MQLQPNKRKRDDEKSQPYSDYPKKSKLEKTDDFTESLLDAHILAPKKLADDAPKQAAEFKPNPGDQQIITILNNWIAHNCASDAHPWNHQFFLLIHQLINEGKINTHILLACPVILPFLAKNQKWEDIDALEKYLTSDMISAPIEHSGFDHRNAAWFMAYHRQWDKLLVWAKNKFLNAGTLTSFAITRESYGGKNLLHLFMKPLNARPEEEQEERARYQEQDQTIIQEILDCLCKQKTFNTSLLLNKPDHGLSGINFFAWIVMYRQNYEQAKQLLPEINAQMLLEFDEVNADRTHNDNDFTYTCSVIEHLLYEADPTLAYPFIKLLLDAPLQPLMHIPWDKYKTDELMLWFLHKDDQVTIGRLTKLGVPIPKLGAMLPYMDFSSIVTLFCQGATYQNIPKLELPTRPAYNPARINPTRFYFELAEDGCNINIFPAAHRTNPSKIKITITRSAVNESFIIACLAYCGPSAFNFFRSQKFDLPAPEKFAPQMSAECVLEWLKHDITFFNSFFLKHIAAFPSAAEIQGPSGCSQEQAQDLLFQRKIREAYDTFHRYHPAKPSDAAKVSFPLIHHKAVDIHCSIQQEYYWRELALQNMQKQAILFGMISALIEDRNIVMPTEIMRDILFLALGNQHGINYAFVEGAGGAEVCPQYKPLLKADIQFGRELYAYRKKHSTGHKREVKILSAPSAASDSPSELFIKSRFFSTKALSLSSSSSSSSSALSASSSTVEASTSSIDTAQRADVSPF